MNMGRPSPSPMITMGPAINFLYGHFEVKHFVYLMILEEKNLWRTRTGLYAQWAISTPHEGKIAERPIYSYFTYTVGH
jgi:hypothetical protein